MIMHCVDLEFDLKFRRYIISLDLEISLLYLSYVSCQSNEFLIHLVWNNGFLRAGNSSIGGEFRRPLRYSGSVSDL